MDTFTRFHLGAVLAALSLVWAGCTSSSSEDEGGGDAGPPVDTGDAAVDEDGGAPPLEGAEGVGPGPTEGLEGPGPVEGNEGAIPVPDAGVPEEDASVPEEDAGVEPTGPCDGDPCENGGTCEPNASNNDYICTCTVGFEGKSCETPVDPCAENPCANGGTCEPKEGEFGFTCTCAAGFEGETCEDIADPCDAEPCQNGGECTSHLDDGGTYTCACAAGFFGADCESACAQGNCAGAVTCDPADGSAPKCTEGCADGFHGEDCTATCGTGNEHCDGALKCGQADGANVTCTGTCEAGYDGADCSGDLDACAANPCFTGVACTDKAAPDTGFTCGPCPTGLDGDGITCVDPVAWFAIWGKADRDGMPTGTNRDMDVVADANGDVYVSLSFPNEINIGPTPDTLKSARFGGGIASFGPDGTYRWAKGFGTTNSGDLIPLRLLVHPQTGDIVVVATGWGGNARIGTTEYGAMNGNGTTVVARLAHDTGEPVWVKLLDISKFNRGDGLAIDGDGNILVAGYFNQGMDLGTVKLTSTDTTHNDGYVVWLSGTDGSPIKGTSFGAKGVTEAVSGVAPNPSGDAIVVGWYSEGNTNIGGVDLTKNGTNNEDCFFARLQADGKAVYAHSISTPSREALMEVRTGPSGDFYIGGWWDGSTEVNGVKMSGSSYGTILARVNGETGDYVWATGHRGGGNAYWGFRRFLIDADENVRYGITTRAGKTTLFGTNDATPPESGLDTHIGKVDGKTGASLEDDLIKLNGPILYSNNLALTTSGASIIAGSFNGDGMLFSHPFKRVAGQQVNWWSQYVIQFNTY